MKGDAAAIGAAGTVEGIAATILLCDVADLRSGYHLRGGIKRQPAGRYRLIQIGDLQRDRPVRFLHLTRTDLKEEPRDNLIRRGDVLLVGRGLRNDAVAVEEELQDTVASSQLFIIRPARVVSPQFLAWYLNQEPAQRYLGQNRAGTNVPIITKEGLARLPVTVPPLEKQEIIVRIHRLSVKEASLLEAIQQKRRRLVEVALLKGLQAQAVG
jgi:hypothetical protein